VGDWKDVQALALVCGAYMWDGGSDGVVGGRLLGLVGVKPWAASSPWPVRRVHVTSTPQTFTTGSVPASLDRRCAVFESEAGRLA
jgi:hypothetical protein